MSNALWMNKDTVLSAMAGAEPIFLLSSDTPEALKVRAGKVAYVYNGANFWWYHSQYNYAVQAGEQFAKTPSNAHATPTGISISDTGRLIVRWNPTANETLYPTLDGVPANAATAPIRSFVLIMTQWMNGNGVGGLHMNSADARPWIVGTVGEKGSGADLEFEGLSEWKHGRPLYLPGNQLELPLCLMRTQTPRITGTPSLGLVGRPYTFQPHAHYVGRAVQWSVVEGALPTALSLDPSTGTVSGYPASDGTARITLRATGEDGEVRRTLMIGIGEARLWRIVIDRNNGSTSHMSLQEVEWRRTAGGPDATSPSTSVRATSFHDIWRPSSTVDNDLSATDGRGWLSAYLDLSPQALEYDLGAPVAIKELAMWPLNHTSGTARAPRDFTVQASLDGVAWTEVAAFKDVTDWVAGTPKTFSLA